MSDIDDRLKAAQVRKFEAEAANMEAEADRHRALTEQARLENEAKAAALEDSRIRYAQAARTDAWKQSHDIEHGVYYFNDSVSDTSVAHLRDWLGTHCRVYPAAPITIIFNSPGGSVYDGLDAGDCIEEAIDAGHHVTTKIAGMSASMAGALVQFGSERVIGRNSWLHLHLHEAAAGSMGKASAMKDAAKRLDALTLQICELYAKRAKGAIGDKAMTAEQIHAMIDRQEIWLTATEALELGFVDRIG